jgi:LEA14-like dessication related protein
MRDPAPLLTLLALIVLLSPSCATTALPRAEFYGMAIQTVQPDPKKDDIELTIGLDFQVKNPLDVKLIVPKHEFSLAIGGARLGATGTKQEVEVAKKGKKLVRYDFTFQLNDRTIGKSLGKDATFSFGATADVDLPQHILRTLELDKTAAGEALGELGEALEEAVGAAVGKGQKGKKSKGGKKAKSKKNKGFQLQFAHEGRVRLPKMPVVRAPADATPEVRLVTGTTQVPGLRNIEQWMKPVAALFQALAGGKSKQELRLPVAELLSFLGVPKAKASTAVAAINTALSLTGGSRVASADGTVPVRFDLDLGEALRAVDPKAKKTMEDFLSGWTRNQAAFTAISGSGLAIPEGMALAVPFRLQNPNEFPITAPAFRFGLTDDSGKNVAIIQVLPERGEVGKAGSKGALLTLGAEKTAEMQLVSEVNWALLGLGLQSLQGGDASKLKLAGELVVDLGLGPLTIPFSFALPPPK